MKATLLSAALAAASAAHLAGAAVLWDGRFNDFTSSADLNKWSWANQVGPYQYYIHGSAAVDKYVNLSPDYKNPADAVSKQGAKFTLDGTAFWNGQNMRRTEYVDDFLPLSPLFLLFLLIFFPPSLSFPTLLSKLK